jgi:acyl-homoserine lactone synthase
MIHVIDAECTIGAKPLLQSMFADRKRLFVDFFGWEVPVVDDQYESTSSTATMPSIS